MLHETFLGMVHFKVFTTANPCRYFPLNCLKNALFSPHSAIEYSSIPFDNKGDRLQLRWPK